MARVLVSLLAGFVFLSQSDGFQPDSPDRGLLVSSAGSFLGIGVQEVDAERAKALGLREERGVEVTRVAEDSPAAKAGFQVGDVVLEYHGQPVEGVEQFMRMVRETPPGRGVKVTVYRSGSSRTMNLTTAARKGTIRDAELGLSSRFEMPEFPMPDLPRPNLSWRSTSLGIDAEALQGQLAEYFGVHEGVLVRSVVKGSAADRAGIHAGDVVVRVDGSRVSSPAEVSSAIRSARAQKEIALQIVREKREMPIAVALDQKQSKTIVAPPPRVKP